MNPLPVSQDTNACLGTYCRLTKEWDKLSTPFQDKVLSDLRALIRHRVAHSGQMWPKDELRPYNDQARFEEEFLSLSVLPADSEAEDNVCLVGPAERTRQATPPAARAPEPRPESPASVPDTTVSVEIPTEPASPRLIPVSEERLRALTEPISALPKPLKDTE